MEVLAKVSFVISRQKSHMIIYSETGMPQVQCNQARQ